MKPASQPLVSVLTPVYNSEKYLTECIESVLAQTYGNWEYTIVNNCSTDRTLEIAQKYAEKDARIRIHNTVQFLDVIQNHNHAFRLMSGESKYCKVLQADDWLFPECIARMVEVAEEHPAVGIVGSYRLDDVWINCDGLPYPSTVISGREICRSTLNGGPYVFGSPSSHLIRSALIRKCKAFYNEHNLHADKEACFEVLRESDFGFVHQVLSFTRRENESMTKTFALKYSSHILGDLKILIKYGPVYLSDNEFKRALKIKLEGYYGLLGRSVFKKRGKDFWAYHKNGLKDLGYPIDMIKLTKTFAALLFNRIMDALKIG